MTKRITVHTHGKGLTDITDQVQQCLHDSGVTEGLCSLIIQHTSASLTIQENADPSARRDLEAWLDRLVPQHDPLYTHTAEGPDDMPSHIKAALTLTTLPYPSSPANSLWGRGKGYTYGSIAPTEPSAIYSSTSATDIDLSAQI